MFIAGAAKVWLRKLRAKVALFVDWMANKSPPWAALWAFLASRLLAVNKMPGIRPLGCGEIWHHLFAKVLLMVAMLEAEIECGTNQLWGGLRLGIEGGIQAMKTAWTQMKEEEEMGFLLIDARNAFNEGNRTKMLWTIRHLWSMGARFTYNCYRNHSQLYLWSADCRELTIILSWKGSRKGTPWPWLSTASPYSP